MSIPWKPSREEAQFIGECMAIDAGVAEHVTEMLRNGHSLTFVQDTLRDAMSLVKMLLQPAKEGR